MASLKPHSNKGHDLGDSSTKWGTVHSGDLQTETLTASGNVEIQGDLTVTGTQIVATVDTVEAKDPLISLAKDNTADTFDIGFYGKSVNASSETKYHGIVRDADDSGKFKVFKDASAEPGNAVGAHSVATVVADLEVPAGSSLKLPKSDDSLADYVTGISLGTASANKVLTVDANKDLTAIRNITATGEINAGDIKISGNSITSTGGSAPEFGNVTITGGSIKDTTIGADGASTAAFTTLTASGDTELNANVTLGFSQTDDIKVEGRLASNIVPNTDDSYDLGSDLLRMNHVYSHEITASTINAFAAGGAIDFNSQEMTEVNIDSGAIDGTVIGATSAAAANVTNLDVSGTAQVDGDLTLSGGDGALTFDADASSIKIPDNKAAALVIEQADEAYLTFVTTDSAEKIVTNKALDASAGITLAADEIETSDIKNKNVTLAKIQDVAEAKILVGPAGGGALAEQTISGDATLDASGELTITDDAVTYAKMQNVTTANRLLGSTSADGIIAELQVGTEMIADDQVTNAKLANIARGSIKVGGVSNAPTDLDAKGNGKILVGDGTDISSVTVSGDVTLASSGAVTIAADVVDNTKLANITIGSVKVGGTSDAPTDLDLSGEAKILVGQGADTALQAVNLSGDVLMTKTGAVTIQPDAVIYSKMQNIATANRVLGSTSANGAVSEVQIQTNMIADDQVTAAKLDDLLTNNSGTAGNYGDATAVASFVVDAQGRLTAAEDKDISIAHTQVNDFDAGVQANRLDEMAIPTAAVSLNSQKITNLATPTDNADAATKSYVDGVAQGLKVHDNVKLATTANGALASAFANGQTIDGVALATNDRILIKNQTDASENGIYVVQASGAPSRASDMDAAAEFAGSFVFVTHGTDNADCSFVCTVEPDNFTLGSTDVTWAQFASAGQITASTGLTKTGNSLSITTLATNRALVSDESGNLSASGISSTEVGYLDGVSSNIQTQLDDKQALNADLTALSSCQTGAAAALALLTSDEVKILDGATVSTAELNYVSGVTSSIQTQLNAKAPIADPTFTGEIGIGSVNVSETELGILEGATVTTAELNQLDGISTTSSVQAQLNSKQPLDSELTELATMATATAEALADLSSAEVAFLDGASAGTAQASKTLVLDASKDVASINSLSSTTLIGTTVVKVDNDNKLEATGLTAGQVAVDSITIDNDTISSSGNLILNCTGTGSKIKLNTNDDLELQGTGGDLIVGGDTHFARGVFNTVGEAKTDDHTLADGEHIVLFDLSSAGGDKTITLQASDSGAITNRVIKIKNIGSSNTLKFNSSSQIDGAAASSHAGLTSGQKITLIATSENGWQSI